MQAVLMDSRVWDDIIPMELRYGKALINRKKVARAWEMSSLTASRVHC